MAQPDFSSRDAQDAVDTIYARTKMPVVLTDRDFVVIASSAHPRTDENRISAILARETPPQSQDFVRDFTLNSVARCIEVPRQPGIGMNLRRWCLPVRQRGGDYFFWLLESDSQDIDYSLKAASLYTSAMSSPELTEWPSLGAKRHGPELLECFNSDPDRAEYAMNLVMPPPASESAFVTILSGDAVRLELLGRQWEQDSSLAPVQFNVADSGIITSICPRSLAAKLLGAIDTVSGVGQIAMGAACLVAGHEDAALNRARFMSLVAHLPDSPAAMVWEQSGPWIALSHLPLRWESLDLLAPGLRSIVQEKPDLANTALTYLGADSIDAAADNLHIHRNTLYYRLGQVTKYLGPGWDRGWARTAMHQGLRLAQVIPLADEYLW